METFKKGVFLTSGIFNVDVEGVKTAWMLRCYPNDREVEGASEGKVCLYLLPSGTAAKDIEGKITFSVEIVDRHGSHVKKSAFKACYEEIKLCKFRNFITQKTLKTFDEKLLPGGSLTLFCTLTFAGSDQVTMKPISPMNIELEHKDDRVMLELLKTGELADVEVVCDQRSFLCHKFIMACKSPVFRAAFTHDMKENSSGKITIQDFDPQTVEDMLAHIYGGEIEGLGDKANKLLAIADKYDLKQLKKQCEALLANNLHVNNCLNSLILADLHSAVILKPIVMKFVVEHSEEVVSLDNWKGKITAFPELFIDVFNEIASKNKRKK